MTLTKLSKSLIITLTASALIMASTALAAEKEHKIKSTEPTVEKRQPAASTPAPGQERVTTQMQPATEILKIRKIIGMTVENTQGSNLGEINDVVVDPSDGSIVYVVVEAGGFLGLGEKFFAIPWGAFQTLSDDDDRGELDRLVLDVDKDRLQNAPGFDKDNWPNMADAQWGATVHSYYDQQDQWARRHTTIQGDNKMSRHDASSSATAQAGTQISATVQQVRGNTIELQVPESMMQDLQAGDRVEVNIKK